MKFYRTISPFNLSLILSRSRRKRKCAEK